VLIGKPEKTFFDLALADLDLLPKDVLMIGDDIESDIIGAAQLNICTCMVQTGKFRQVDVDQSKIKPDYIIPSIADLFTIDLF